MMKKLMLVVMAFTLFFAFTAPHAVDAKRSGGFKSGTRSYTNTPKKSNDYNSTKSSNTTTGQNAKRGFFSGGGFMKGLMIGGLAGMLFGGMFSNMGFLGNIFGLLINLLAIYVVVMIGIALYRKFRKPRYNDHRGGRY
ncbi:hypothetical protein [Paenibacillus sp. J22TS3]|uniref:hypothetical protein n=1 Tax=Paenibacillus sp. J22TS3 TaxID=2807192 RepID=UPI001B220897|nr:hypothetical protein [Paenibacillus sp. J22TS3]GIP20554.1 hypothetical protein J22TS3_08290 [Paenibacillus sp. J22TS3]